MDVHCWHLHADPHLYIERALTGAVVWLLLAVPAFAQAQAGPKPPAGQVSVEVSPLRVELAAGPGSTTTQAVTVMNSGAEPVRVRARLSDWDLSRDGTPQFEAAPPRGPFSATAWTRIAPPEVVIEPAKETVVRFSLAVPAGTQPGGYRTGILFEFSPASGDPLAAARQVQFRTRIATLIYVNIGLPPLAAELVDLRQRTAGGQIQVVATVKNTSRRYTRTKGSLLVYDPAGKLLHEAPVPDVPLLPESEREVAVVATDPAKKIVLPPGDYRVELKLDVGLPALVVGETTIKVPR